MPPFPIVGGNDQFNGNVKGALYVTLPPQELDIINVPVLGILHGIFNEPDIIYVSLLHVPAIAVNVLQVGATYVVGKIVSPPTVEKTALTVQLLPAAQRLGKVKFVEFENGGLKTIEPPHVLVTVSVPVVGGLSEVTVPVRSNNPVPKHGPGLTDTLLQLVAPDPAVPALVWVKLITPGRFEKLVIKTI